jgi:predicted phage terminase large subunit-like protein
MKIDISLEEVQAALAKRKHLRFMQWNWQREDPFIVGIHTKAICSRIDKAVEDYRAGLSTFLTIKLCFRHGKLLADDTPVFTPIGWRIHGELKPGDYVFDGFGIPTKVVAVSRKDMANVELIISDGCKIKAHLNHEWDVYDRCQQKNRRVTTEFILNHVSDSVGRSRFCVAANAVVSLPQRELVIDPYILGVWLGDGSRDKNCITYGEKKRGVIKEIERIGYVKTSVCVHKDTKVETAYFRELYGQLVKEKLLHKEKHIPPDYLLASVEQRTRLLAGLIDSDGYVNNTGRVCFSNANYRLIKDVKTLVNSLGSRVSICAFSPRMSSSGIQGKQTVYQLLFVPRIDVPTVRMVCRGFVKKTPRRGIMSATLCDGVPGKCIQVEGGTYLAGETMIPTHNSDIVSRYLPPHYLGEFPDNEVIVAGYSASLTADFSKFARRLVKSDQWAALYPDVRISKDEQSVDVWGIEKRLGKAHWVGIGGSVTGKGASLLIVDDFFKNREEAESEVIREKTWDSFTNDLMTRRAPVCIVIVLATPWHTDDLFGRIRKAMDDDSNFPRFEDLRFPARSEEYREKNGTEYLFPERFEPSWYESQFTTLGPYSSSAMLQCDPVVRHGNMLRIDGIQYYDTPPENVKWSRGWDLASSEKQLMKDNPDFTAGIKLGVKWLPNTPGAEPIPVLYIDDFICGQWNADARNEKIRQKAMEDGPIEVGIEAYGPYKDAFDQMTSILWGVRKVVKVHMPGDKVTRAGYLEPIFHAGNVFMRKAGWNESLIRFLGEFPGGAHDDPIDALVTAFALHKPYVKHVWPHFNTIETMVLDIHWGKKDERNALHYGAVVMEKDLSMWLLSTLWDDISGQLFIYDSMKYEEPNVAGAAAWMINHMKLREYRIDRICCNDTMCIKPEGSERTMQMLFRDEFKKFNCTARLNEAIHYDQWGAITQVNTLTMDKRIFVDEEADDALRQFSSWGIEKNKPEVDGRGYCEGLCLIISELRRKKVFEKAPKRVDYMRKEEVRKALHEDKIIRERRT